LEIEKEAEFACLFFGYYNFRAKLMLPNSYKFLFLVKLTTLKWEAALLTRKTQMPKVLNPLQQIK